MRYVRRGNGLLGGDLRRARLYHPAIRLLTDNEPLCWSCWFHLAVAFGTASGFSWLAGY
jgi:hypothetical protein